MGTAAAAAAGYPVLDRNSSPTIRRKKPLAKELASLQLLAGDGWATRVIEVRAQRRFARSRSLSRLHVHKVRERQGLM